MEDFISRLPNDLLYKILLNLPTKESVRTSVLSTRWRHLWKNVSGLVFYDRKFDVLDFLIRFLNLHKESPIYLFTFGFYDVDDVDIPPWKLLIEQVLTRRVQLFKLSITKLHVNFYTCETLVNLHLEYVTLADFDGNEIINLPRLQIMHLQFVTITNDVVLEMLISSSPVLQHLRLSYMHLGRVNVKSQTLRSLRLNEIIRSGFVIDTPNLDFLHTRGISLEFFKIESVSSSIKICIDVRFGSGNDYFSKMQFLHKFYAGISRVTDLSISGLTLEGIYNTYSKVLQHQQLPEFKNLTSFYALFFSNFSEMLPLYLSSFPNLKSINLEFLGYPNMEKIANSPVPQCFQTSIENVNIKLKHDPCQERNRKAQIEFAKYILKNAKTLKKFTLWLDEEEDVCSSVLEQILTFRSSPSVEVKIVASHSRLRWYIFI